MNGESFYTGVQLSQLLNRHEIFHSDGILVDSCCVDYRRCRPGDLYVALVEADQDGHDYVHEAVENGATAILSERLLPVSVPQCVVPNSRAAFGKLCHALAGDPSQELRTIGIAGSQSKTSTQMLLAAALEAHDQRPAVFGSLGFSDGFDAQPRNDSEPNAARIATWMAEAKANACTHAIAELPRQYAVKGHFAGMRLDVACFTGFHDSLHGKTSPKTLAYIDRVLGRLGTKSLVVANVDCAITREAVQKTKRPLLTIAIHNSADITATIIERSASEQTFLVDAGDDTAVVRTRITGDAIVYSALLAVAAGLSLNIPLNVIVTGIETIESIPGRLERVECGQPFSVFVDGAQQPADLKQSLRTLREVTPGRLICVVGEGDEQNAGLRPQRGRVAERYSDVQVLTSDDPNDDSPLQRAHDLLDGYRFPEKPHLLPNRVRAIEWAFSQAKAGDTVLIVGPHNRRLLRTDEEFLPDAEVARYWLLDNREDSLGWIFAIN